MRHDEALMRHEEALMRHEEALMRHDEALMRHEREGFGTPDTENQREGVFILTNHYKEQEHKIGTHLQTIQACANRRTYTRRARGYGWKEKTTLAKGSFLT